MKVVYGFIFYFCLVMMALTAALAIFWFKRVRRVFFTLLKRYKTSVDNPILQYTIYVSFTIIGLIFVESLIKFLWFQNHMELHHHKGFIGIELDRYDLLEVKKVEDYLVIYKHYREYYMVERNIMLTGSAILTYFIFQRLVVNIKKLVELEEEIEESMNSEDQAPKEGKQGGKVKVA